MIYSWELFNVVTGQQGAAAQTVTPTGIASAEAFGTFSIANTGQFITMTGVPGAEAFGTFQVNINIQPAGVPGGEAFGVFSLTRSIAPGSVPGAEAFGVFTVTPGTAYIVPDGVVGGEAFGTFRLNQQILPSGVFGGEAFGVFSLTLYLRPTGIPGGEAFGLFRFVEGQTVDIGGIPGAEAFGVFSIWNVWQFVSPDSIPGAEAFGVFTVSHPTAPGQHTQFETDIEEVFLTNNADFAESVEIHYKDDDHASHSLMAIFDNEYIGADVDSEFVVQMRQPMVIIQTRKLRRKLQRGDWMKVRGVTYSVITSEPDGTGISEITLKHKV